MPSRSAMQFLDEYRAAKTLRFPPGYAFRVDGRPTLPNLMQRHVAVQVRDETRVGNWSGTGAGKTLSAILASRVVGSRADRRLLPEQRRRGLAAGDPGRFPAAAWRPRRLSRTGAQSHDPTGFGTATTGPPRYLVLNYEAFQQPDSASASGRSSSASASTSSSSTRSTYAKQRHGRGHVPAAAARRRACLGRPPSATPICASSACRPPRSSTTSKRARAWSNWSPGSTTTISTTAPTVPNCMRLHQRLVTLGTRWLPDYDLGYEQVEVPVDCAAVPRRDPRARAEAHRSRLKQILTAPGCRSSASTSGPRRSSTPTTSRASTGCCETRSSRMAGASASSPATTSPASSVPRRRPRRADRLERHRHRRRRPAARLQTG